METLKLKLFSFFEKVLSVILMLNEFNFKALVGKEKSYKIDHSMKLIADKLEEFSSLFTVPRRLIHA